MAADPAETRSQNGCSQLPAGRRLYLDPLVESARRASWVWEDDDALKYAVSLRDVRTRSGAHGLSAASVTETVLRRAIRAHDSTGGRRRTTACMCRRPTGPAGCHGFHGGGAASGFQVMQSRLGRS